MNFHEVLHKLKALDYHGPMTMEKEIQGPDKRSILTRRAHVPDRRNYGDVFLIEQTGRYNEGVWAARPRLTPERPGAETPAGAPFFRYRLNLFLPLTLP